LPYVPFSAEQAETNARKVHPGMEFCMPLRPCRAGWMLAGLAQVRMAAAKEAALAPAQM